MTVLNRAQTHELPQGTSKGVGWRLTGLEAGAALLPSRPAAGCSEMSERRTPPQDSALALTVGPANPKT